MSIIFTRYLYDKEQVEFSLLVSVLNHDREQSKFWAYELYHSGFKLEVIAYLLKLYFHLYQEHYPKLENYFSVHFENWSQSDNSYDEFAGILVENLVIRTPNERKLNSKILIKIKPEDIDKYKTKPVLELKSWKIPRRECKYKLITKPESEPLTIRSYENWLYYASFSPIWKNRIERHGGKILSEIDSVLFETSDDEEQFYNWHNFEPDEQTELVQANWIGKKYDSNYSVSGGG